MHAILAGITFKFFFLLLLLLHLLIQIHKLLQIDFILGMCGFVLRFHHFLIAYFERGTGVKMRVFMFSFVLLFTVSRVSQLADGA